MSLANENSTAPLTAADVAAVTRNNGNCGGFGGDWLIAIVILFLFPMMFGGGMWGNGMFGGGWGGNGFNSWANGALTRADLCSEFNFNGLENGVRNINDAVNVGFSNLNSTICHQQYDTAMLVNGVNASVINGFHGVDNAVCQLGYQTQQGFNAANVVALQNQNALQTQLANCCCENRTGQMQLGNQMERGFCDVNYTQATNTNAVIQNAHNDTDRVLAKLDAMEMARKDETIADLRTKLAACGDQTTAQYIINQLTGVISPRAVPAYPAASPCGLGNWSPQVLANSYGYNNGCGCNTGCCGCNG